tara:strand:- start:398 stop:1234 length:837 start_codon:yes stop_codon:yes gene_type:complete
MKWVYDDMASFYYGGAKSVHEYNKLVVKRREKNNYTASKHSDLIDEIDTNGYAIIKNAFSEDIVKRLSEDFNRNVRENNISINNEHFIFIPDPLYNSETAFSIATSDLIYEISSEFFRCVPSLCTQNFRLSKLNLSNPNTTQIYHCDRNSYVKFIKFFIYLNDVDKDGGPLTFIKGSHKKKPMHHCSKYRWDEEEIIRIYGEEAVTLLTASAGDLLIANTTGFHKGTKPINMERRMLTLNYVIHKETDLSTLFKARQKWVNKLPDHKKVLFDFMKVTQ